MGNVRPQILFAVGLVRIFCNSSLCACTCSAEPNRRDVCSAGASPCNGSRHQGWRRWLQRAFRRG